jgi:hypothetical protein
MRESTPGEWRPVFPAGAALSNAGGQSPLIARSIFENRLTYSGPWY